MDSMATVSSRRHHFSTVSPAFNILVRKGTGLYVKEPCVPLQHMDKPTSCSSFVQSLIYLFSKLTGFCDITYVIIELFYSFLIVFAILVHFMVTFFWD